MDSKGNRLTTYSHISQEAILFFQKLLGTVDYKVEECTQALLTELLQVSLSSEMAVELVKPVTPAEIKSIMFGINGEKAPGPYGYTSQFFKAAWNVVGEDVTRAVKYFFHTSKLFPAFNSTIVALVPKC